MNENKAKLSRISCRTESNHWNSHSLDSSIW